MDTKWHLGFMGICRDRVCWTLLDHWTMVSVRFHGLACFALSWEAAQDDNTRKQPLSDASVKIDGSTS